MHLTHDELFVLTPFQFKELYDGLIERTKIASIGRAELEITIINANRWDAKQKAAQIDDILPWYEDYIREKEGKSKEYVAQPEIDQSIPQLERVIKRLLEQKGLDPDGVQKGSPEWIETERIAISCVTGGQSYTLAPEGAAPPQGIQYKKADPNEWGRPPWEIEDEMKAAREGTK